MKELLEYFTLLLNVMNLFVNKTGETRLGFSSLLKFFQYEARFPDDKYDIPTAIIQYIAKQVNVEQSLYAHYDWNGRSIRYHRAQIRDFFGFREATVQDTEAIGDWLERHVLYYDHEFDHVKEQAYLQFRERKIEPASPKRVERMVRSAINAYEDKFFQSIYENIPQSSLAKLDVLLDNNTINDVQDYSEDLSIQVDSTLSFI